jgi:hypothetical protein
MAEPARRICAAAGVALLVGALVGAVACERRGARRRTPPEAIPPVHGRVFEDLDGDGRFDPGEPGVAGVAVHRGFELALSGADGRYELSGAAEARGSSNDRFVWITRSARFDGDRWYRSAADDPIDFPLQRRPPDDEEGFTFVQLSDAHVFDRASDFVEFSSGPDEWWLPEIVRSGVILHLVQKMAEPRYTGDAAEGLRAYLRPHLGEDAVAALWDVELPRALVAEFAREGSALSRVDATIREAFAELRSLAPDFAVSTGDLVLESNDGSAEAIERWMRFYQELVADLGFPVYDTIGNNELAGIHDERFALGDPGFGKGLYHRHFGPSHYSFDRGRFHFVALDTHAKSPYNDDPRSWRFDVPEAGFWSWVDRDLEAHSDRIPVLLNHEPFLYDPSWSMDEEDFAPVRGEDGRLVRHGVVAVLTGHTHQNGLVRRDGVTHITTGALSGFRWVLPPDVFHRGYRLFHAHGARLYSAWKRLGHPVVAFVDPPGSAAHHPASAGELEPGERRVVAVAADARGPFPGVRILLDGQPLPLERWGPYFVAASVPAGRRTGTGALVVEAISLDGRLLQDTAHLEAPGGGAAP